MSFRGDICLCTNTDCTQKQKCYRYMATPCQLQSYAAFDQKDGKCDYFMPIHEDEKDGIVY